MDPDGIPAHNNELVTASTPSDWAPAASADGLSTQAFSHTSLMHGWVPIIVQVVTGVALLLAVGWRTRTWRLRWLPIAALAGGAVAYGTRAYVSRLSTEPGPVALWAWAGLAGMAVTVLLLGWRSAQWWRRGIALLAVPLCLLSTALTLNMWVGYFPTVQAAWGQLTSGPLPDQTDPATVAAMIGKSCAPAARQRGARRDPF